MSFLRELRETARVCVKPEIAQLLRDAADELHVRLNEVHADPTIKNMQALNGAWVLAANALKAAPPLGGDGAQGGAVALTEEQKKAA